MGQQSRIYFYCPAHYNSIHLGSHDRLQSLHKSYDFPCWNCSFVRLLLYNPRNWCPELRLQLSISCIGAMASYVPQSHCCLDTFYLDNHNDRKFQKKRSFFPSCWHFVCPHISPHCASNWLYFQTVQHCLKVLF